MESSLETVALFSLKLVYETDGHSPILRDDPVMDEYQREVFALLVRNDDVPAIQAKMADCLNLALNALGSAQKPLGRELHKLATAFAHAQTLEQMGTPLTHLRGYLKDIQ
ncbi:hypothetical protein CJF39_08910 [Pseudomonas lundensis]|uniref:Uncharacterized protein n=1 Tax=Pseudomonas lundensis TaxID=86185 RepID=A0A266ND05_9PSED|nr:hypothetical protein [Pseudomonas lundensis]OZY59892.1 hypothetical protein CJF39_08910 [Pseudomonas lundensis]